ncbi:MAG: pabB [Dehalococcoidia bacterium]|nr:pabB [Dehalococcoidia bacterium]
MTRAFASLPHPARLLPAFLDMPYPALLDGAMPGAPGGRFSYLTADPFMVVRSRGRHVTIERGSVREEIEDDPWSVLQGLLRQHRGSQATGLPPFQGGALGYWSYDLGRHLEHLPSWAWDDLGLPEMYLGLYDWALAYDGDTGQSHLFSTGLPEGTEERARLRAEEVMRRLKEIPRDAPSLTTDTPAPLRSNFTPEAYKSAVRRVKEYLAAGDVYQVNLSQRFQRPFQGDPWALYQRLRLDNPAPFAAYLGFPEVVVLSASPEEFLRLDGGQVRVRPIKGTRPTGRSREEDSLQAAELLASEKERAENVMIVDLLRNDVGRVCKIGSVRVPSLFAVERHPTVLHLVSTITGELLHTADAIDLLRACFPGGSVTGAPKVRAMEIIEELEPVRRGIYCGALGYISFGGDMGASIVIRTLVLTGGQVYLQLGGGIVADSDPEAEYQETLDKGLGLRRALGCDD